MGGIFIIHRIDFFIEKVLSVLDNHKSGSGQYSRWIWQNAGTDRELGVNPYGCADAANILYTLGYIPHREEREAFVRVLQQMQDSASGMYYEKTHHPIHTTAHCIAALELFDEKPIHKIRTLEKYNSPEKICEFLENLEWKHNPWQASHQGAGIYVLMNLTDMVDSEWNEAYFEWLWNEADPVSGFWRNGSVGTEQPIFHSLAGSFHYLFNLESAAMPLRYPEKMIDSCLEQYQKMQLFKEDFAKGTGFAEIDWIYCLNRAMRQTDYRYREGKECLKRMADIYIPYLNGIDEKTDEDFNDLHCLFGAVCAVAELQQALPGYIRSKRKLKLVLDRRPFI